MKIRVVAMRVFSISMIFREQKLGVPARGRFIFFCFVHFFLGRCFKIFDVFLFFKNDPEVSGSGRGASLTYQDLYVSNFH